MAGMEVALRNASPQPFVVVLTHEVYCAGGGACACARVRRHRALYRGRKFEGMQEVRMIEPTSVGLAPGETGQFHPSVLRLPQVRAGLQARQLRQVESPSAPGS